MTDARWKIIYSKDDRTLPWVVLDGLKIVARFHDELQAYEFVARRVKVVPA